MSDTTGRILALDVGGKRIGVAISDPNRLIASGQPTISGKSQPQIFEHLRQLVQDYEITEIVIGLPLTLRGEIGPQAEIVQSFSRGLAKVVKVPIKHYDERLTSIAAERSLEEMGVKKHKRRDHVDELAAVLILQAYLDSLRVPAWNDSYDEFEEF